MSAAFADADPTRWRIAAASDGMVTASVPADNKLMTTGGALSYSPTFSVACRPDGEAAWHISLQLADAVSADRSITVSVRLGGAAAVEESWTVGPRKKLLVREGEGVVARLVNADRIRLSWRFGLLSGRGEANVDLAGVEAALSAIAARCGVAPPTI